MTLPSASDARHNYGVPFEPGSRQGGFWEHIDLKNNKWVWSGNTIITNCRQTHGTARKSHITITRHQEDKLSKVTSSLFPIKMIAWNKCDIFYLSNQMRKENVDVGDIMTLGKCQWERRQKQNVWAEHYSTLSEYLSNERSPEAHLIVISVVFTHVR